MNTIITLAIAMLVSVLLWLGLLNLFGLWSLPLLAVLTASLWWDAYQQSKEDQDE